MGARWGSAVVRTFGPVDPRSTANQDILPRYEWRDSALCAQTDPELFFPTIARQSGFDAKKVCAACPVQVECLEFALGNDVDFGIFGGLTPRERWALRQQVAS